MNIQHNAGFYIAGLTARTNNVPRPPIVRLRANINIRSR
jgi:hypothetical protein